VEISLGFISAPSNFPVVESARDGMCVRGSFSHRASNASKSTLSKIARNVKEACALVNDGFEYVTGEYKDGGKIFRKPKYYL
jgi:hypothetical protein